LENAVDVEFDLERWAAEDCDVVDVVFELVDDDFEEEEPHAASEIVRPTAARRASVLIMILMMSDRALPFPTIGALDLL
jgi:hypothetical protein